MRILSYGSVPSFPGHVKEKFLSLDEDKPQSIYTAHLIASYLSVTTLFNLLQSLRQAGVGGCIAGTLESGRGPSPKEGKGSPTGGSLSCQYRLRVFVKHPQYRFYTF